MTEVQSYTIQRNPRIIKKPQKGCLDGALYKYLIVCLPLIKTLPYNYRSQLLIGKEDNF